jgi:hypothetical protein
LAEIIAAMAKAGQSDRFAEASKRCHVTIAPPLLQPELPQTEGGWMPLSGLSTSFVTAS